MNSSGQAAAGRPLQRRELQGPRPTPLKVSKDSYKIGKPPAAPPPRQVAGAGAGGQIPAAGNLRQPVIIYTVSPKVIHTNPGEFMSLVQRLTGSSSSSSSFSDDNPSPAAAAMSPAARLASFERSATYSSPRSRRLVAVPPAPMAEQMDLDPSNNAMDLMALDPGGGGDRTAGSSFPGILSPLPTSLPLISPGFFSPAVDPNALSFLHELSPAFHGNRSFVEHTFLASPGNLLASTPNVVPSPTGAIWDLFNQFQDP